MNTELIAISIAAASAAASAVSAYTSRQAVERAHRPFVWPAIAHDNDDGQRVLKVRLHNDGPGTAFHVRYSMGSVTADQHDAVAEDTQLTKDAMSLVIRALKSGESSPIKDGHWLERALPMPPDDVGWVLVRWTDAAGARWEYSDQGPAAEGRRPRRLRTWTWQVWRPKRDW